MDEILTCTHCGAEIKDDEYHYIGDDVICQDCVDDYCVNCDHCGELVWESETYSDENTIVCRSCYERYYTRCYECGEIIREDCCYEYEGDYYCCDCYNDICDNPIHEYNYKPCPIFYGDGSRYFGVELEIDKGGKYNDNADSILCTANKDGAEFIYIKSDGSLDDGMEIVTHPMSLDFHMNNLDWAEILRKCVVMGYRSHQTSTCGLHVHVNRDCLGDTYDEKDETISKILYFVEHHWNELLTFSRRTESAMNRWASRYGYENSAKAILDKAKKYNNGRYAAVNLCNRNTIEFRMFRGTLKLNTFLAVLQMVNRICDTALNLTEEQLKKLSWSEFVSEVTEPELIQYLKERRLYVNENIDESEDM